MTEEKTRVGHVLAPLGVAGGVRLYTIGEPAQLLALPRLYVEGSGWLRIKGIERHGPGVAVAFVGLASREAAERLRGKEVWAADSELPALPEDEFYYHDLRGLPVRTPGGESLGEVEDVIDAGAQDLLVVRQAGRSSYVPLQAPYVEIVRGTPGEAGHTPLEAVILDAPPGLLNEV